MFVRVPSLCVWFTYVYEILIHHRQSAQGDAVNEPRRVGVIGLGIMGAPMAANLLKAGYAVTGHNRSPAAAERLAALGGRAAATVADAVRDADVVLTVLPDTPDVKAV